MEFLMSIGIGLGLSAACGFRVFVPLLVMSLAARGGYLGLGPSFEWIASSEATIAFAIATFLEIGAFYLPVVDNLLDSVATPVAVVAGILATASQVTEFDPLLGWCVAVVAGGTVAGAVQGLTLLSRQFTALTTAGFANPLVATMEVGSSLVFALLSVFAPLLAVIAITVLFFVLVKKLMTNRSRSPESTS